MVGAAAAVALIGGGVWAVTGSDDSTAGNSTLLTAVTSTPHQSGHRLSLGADAWPGGLTGQHLFVTNSGEVEAYDLDSGDRQWHDTGSAVTAVDSGVYMCSENGLLHLNRDGVQQGSALSDAGSCAYINQLTSHTLQLGWMDGFDLVADLDRWTLLDGSIWPYSPNGRYGLRTEYGDTTDVTVVDLQTGRNLGDSMSFASLGELDVMDDGRVVAIDGGDLRLIGTDGDELSRQHLRDGARLDGTVGNFVVVTVDRTVAVFSVAGNEFKRLSDTTEIATDAQWLQPMRINGGFGYVVAGAGSVEVGTIDGRGVRSNFLHTGTLISTVNGAVYVRDDDALVAYSTVGDGKRLWSMTIGADEQVVAFDGAVALVKRSSDGSSTTITVWR